MYEVPSQQVESSPEEAKNPPCPEAAVALDAATVNAARDPIVVASREVFNSVNLPDISIAQGIAELFRATYGEMYPDQRFLDPLKIREEIQNGHYVFAALLDEVGAVLGIGGISSFEYLGANVEEYGSVCEFGKLIISERAQGLGLTADLTQMRLEYARDMGLESVVSLPFSSHDKSQKSLAKQGFLPSGITVCDWDDVLQSGQRESAIFMHKILDPMIKQTRAIYLPAALHLVASIAYESLECRRQFVRPAAVVPIGASPEVRIDEASGGAQIFLHCPLAVDEVLNTLAEPQLADIKHVTVSLDIGNPAALQATESLLEAGFRFAAVHPLGKTDLLTVQKIFDAPSDVLSGVQLHHEATEAILKHILGLD